VLLLPHLKLTCASLRLLRRCEVELAVVYLLAEQLLSRLVSELDLAVDRCSLTLTIAFLIS
jgi:hypothetical protein